MSDDHEPADDDEREEELTSIAAIFPELVRSPDAPYKASLTIPVRLTSPLKIIFASSTPSTTKPTPLDLQESSEDSVEGTNEDCVHHVSHLPSLELQLDLPAGYPQEAPPTFKIDTTPSWLPATRIERLLKEGKALWEELGHDQVLFAYIDHLQQAADDAFGLAGHGLHGSLEFDRDLEAEILDFDIKEKRRQFEQGTFECGICLDPKKGSACYRFVRCSHVSCVECLQQFYSTCIEEGDVAAVKCITPGCEQELQAAKPSSRRRKKLDCTLGPSELVQIPLSQEMVQRYVSLKRKAALESDQNTVYCPRDWCQGPARYTKRLKERKPKKTASERHFDSASECESSDDEEQRQWREGDPEDELPPPNERVAVCLDCSYAFCRVCMAGWHGELQRCWPRKPAQLSAEEAATENYMQRYSSRCPTCSARCQKSHGCNHMCCTKCQTHFCYLCSAWLSSDNPYKHFNEAWSKCYMRLWELEQGDGEGVAHVPDDAAADVGAIAIHDEMAAFLLINEAANGNEANEEVLARIEPNNALLAREMAWMEGPLEAARRRVAAEEGEAIEVGQRGAIAERPRRVAVLPLPRRQPLPAGARANRVDGNRGAIIRPRVPGHGRGPGIRRFLELVERDEEDEWDSDDFEDITDDEGDAGDDDGHLL
ncbi:MAG: hypothetical protein M1825_004127 [Sarcosagium campestre]|nr:MAG: hypothetical protein M1825_004127 [Sarcosagium campestre]